MGWPIGWTALEPLAELNVVPWDTDPHPDIPRIIPKGLPARAARLRALGNGQVPQCMAEAFRKLYKKLNKLQTGG